jgi:hypothetical protein
MKFSGKPPVSGEGAGNVILFPCAKKMEFCVIRRNEIRVIQESEEHGLVCIALKHI